MNMRIVFPGIFGLLFFSASLIVASEKLNVITTPMTAVQTFEQKRCVRCHLIDVSWDAYGPDLARASLSGNFSDIVGRMWNKAPVMLAKMNELNVEFPTVNYTDLIRVASFVGVYQNMLSGYTEGGDVERGATLFHRSKCSNCHASKRMRGAFQSPLKALGALWRHGDASSSRRGQAHVPWSRLKVDDVKDIMRFLTADEFSDNVQSQGRYLAPGDPQQGRKSFAKLSCGSCHDNDGNVKSEAPKKAGHGNQRLEIDRIVTSLWNHSPRAWKTPGLSSRKSSFSAQTLADLIAYWYAVRFERRQDQVALGKKLFESKSCSTCHEIGSADFVVADTKDSFLAQMWSHVPEMVEACQDQDIDWPTMEPGELSAIAAYLVRSQTAESK